MAKKGDLFSSYNATRDLQNYTGRNHGRPWTVEALTELRSLFLDGFDFETIINTIGRSTGEVIPKLKTLGLVYEHPSTARNSWTADLHYKGNVGNDRIVDTPIEVHTQENEMSAQETTKIIEEITLINGVNATSLSDDQIFDLIAKLETKAKVLNNIENKPQKLIAKICYINEDIAKLVAFVDAR